MTKSNIRANRWFSLLRLVPVLGLFATFSAAVGLAQEELPPRYYALVVGVRQYDPNELRSLPYAEPDATELSQILRQKGFRRVVLLTQTAGAKEFRFLPTSKNIRTSLTGLLKNTRKQDVVLVALAGHGVQFRGEKSAYFCPMDAKLKDRRTLISLADIYKQLEGCKAATRLLLVDACRNDPQSDNSRSKNEVKVESVTRPQKVKLPGGMAAFFSCSAGQRAFESKTLKHGLFFHSVIEGLKGKADFRKSDPLTWSELVAWTKGEVPDLLADLYGDGVEQSPELVSNLRGRILLFPKSNATTLLTNSLGMQLKRIPAGEFLMGSPKSEEKRGSDEEQHRVRITKPFHLGVYEVTQAQYARVASTSPSYFSRTGDGKESVAGKNTDDFPVETVSWEDAVEFCRKLSNLPSEKRAGRRYRLPTEAEWEYACRARTTTPFHFGSELNGREANIDGNYPYGTTTKGPYLKRPTNVGSYRPNAFGLYDMHGNVWEWCQDYYDKDYYGKSPVADPRGPTRTSGSSRVVRGGSWGSGAQDARSAYRDFFSADSRISYYGFRVVCELD